MERDAVGTVLILAGVVLLAGTLSVSAALAPDVSSQGGADDRATLVGSQGGGPGWHDHGSVYRLSDTDVVWRAADTDSYFDVTPLPDGRVMAAFMHSGYGDCGPYDSPCTRTGFRVVDPDPEPRVVEEFGFPVRTAKNSEVHDAEPLPSGEVLLTDMDRERIVAVEDGEVTWQWNAADHYEAPPDPTRTDWLHINDVDRIGDGRYLVSVRNANQLVLVERGEGVVETINADDGGDDGSCTGGGQLRDSDGDGDVRCGDPAVLNHQHNPQWLGDGAVLVADSDNDRVVELHRTDDGDWEPAWTLRSAGGVSFNWPRDADRLPNGNTLITDTLNRRIIEVDRNGTVVWSYRTDRIPYEADRLPEGERPRGVPYADDGGQSVESPHGGDVPVLSLALSGLRGAYPALPFWYTELQLGLTLLSLALFGGGVAHRWRLRRG